MSLRATARRSDRTLWFAAGLVVLGMAVLPRLSGPASWPTLPLNDFVQYWASARLILQGDNPYDPVAMVDQERAAGRDADALMMFNPPWTLAVIMPFGLLDHRLAYVLWMALLDCSVAGSAVLLWQYYDGPRAHVGAALLIALTFVPTFLSLFLAQISPLLLLGVTLFLVAERRGALVLAGAAAALMLIKPHLTYLFFAAFMLWSCERRRWPALAGAALAVLAAALVPLARNPHVWVQYRDFVLRHPPAQYSSPTLGAVLRLLFDESNFRLQYLALLPGLAWLAVFYAQRRAAWDWGREMPWLLLVSLLTAAYGAWPYDLVLLIVPVLRLAAMAGERARSLAGFHIAFNAVGGGMIVCLVHFFWFLWMTPVLFAAYVVATWRDPSSRATDEQTIAANAPRSPGAVLSRGSR